MGRKMVGPDSVQVDSVRQTRDNTRGGETHERSNHVGASTRVHCQAIDVGVAGERLKQGDPERQHHAMPDADTANCFVGLDQNVGLHQWPSGALQSLPEIPAASKAARVFSGPRVKCRQPS